MGSSKVIVLSALYLMLGFYSSSFNAADESNFSDALNTATLTQAEQLAKTGVSLALQKLGAPLAFTAAYDVPVVTLGGSITYSLFRPASFPLTQAMVVSTGSYKDVTYKTTAVFYHDGLRWKISRVYTTTI